MFTVTDLNLDFKNKPHRGMLIVLPLLQASLTKSGLIAGAEDREAPQAGIVLKVGDTLVGSETGREVPIEAKPGEYVEFGKYAGIQTHVRVGDELVRVYLMRDTEVLDSIDPGEFDIEFHDDRDLRHLHLKGLECENCPVVKSAIIEEERARLKTERDAAELAKTAVSQETDTAGVV